MKRRFCLIAGIVLGAAVIFTSLYFSAVFVGGIITRGVQPDKESGTYIFLDNNGRHIDIWIPADYFAFTKSGVNHGGWYGFGWGDRDFFLNTPRAGDVKINLLLKALFVPSRAVLAVQYSSQPPEERPSVTKIAAAESDVRKAAEYIEGWFMLNSDGSLQQVSEAEVNPSYTGYTFYESRGSYSLFFTSNNWVNRVLKAAGIRTGLWTPFTFGVGP